MKLLARLGSFPFVKRIDSFLILAFIIPFAIYMMTLAPSVTFFDSGEFLTAAYSLGSAHSPGYPLFLMYAKPFTWLPLGNIAFRINLATAFSASLACVGVYLLSLRLLKSEERLLDESFSCFAVKGAALAAALSFGFTPRLWLQSNHDKPYPLLSFIMAAIFLLLLEWREHYVKGEDRPAYIYACTFLAGLSMALHQTVVLFLPAWFLFIILTDWRIIMRIKELILATAFALLGFSVHLYLPLRATQNPILNWGDPKTYDRFLWHFLRKGYPSEPHSRDFPLLWEQIKAFSINHEFTLLGVVLAGLSFVYLWRHHRVFAITYLASVICFISVIAGYLNTPLETIFLTEEFFTPIYLLSAVLIGVGLYQMLGWAARKARLPDSAGFREYSLIAFMFFILPIFLCVKNYYENDQHDNYIAYDYATNSLRSLPQNAIMFTWGDSGAFPLWYLQGVERMREDLDLPHTPHLVFDWYIDGMPRLFSNSTLKRLNMDALDPEACLRISISENFNHRPIYIDFSTRYSVSFTNYLPVQKGIVYRMRRSSEPSGLPDYSVWEWYNMRGILDKMSFLDLDTGKAILIYANSYLEAGEFLFGSGKTVEGMQMLTMAEKISPDIKPAVMQVLTKFGIAK